MAIPVRGGRGARADRGGQRVQAAPDVGVQPDGDVVVRVHLGGKAVQVDDLRVALRVDPRRVELLQLVADGDDQVGAVEAEVDVVVPHEPHRAQRQRVVVGEHALAVERGRHRDAQRLGEAAQGRAGPGARGTVAGQHDRGARRAQQRRRPLDLPGGRLVRAWHVHRKRLTLGRGLLHVLGDRQVDRPGPLGLGQLERLADHLGHRARRRHQRRPLDRGREHRHQVHALVRLLEAAVHADLRRQRDQRRGVGGRVRGAEQQVDRPGAERGRAHPGAAGQPAVDLGHERRALLVPGQHVPDGRAGDGVHQPDVLLARDAEDVRDALVLQALDDQGGGAARRVRHAPRLSRGGAGREAKGDHRGQGRAAGAAALTPAGRPQPSRRKPVITGPT